MYIPEPWKLATRNLNVNGNGIDNSNASGNEWKND